MHEKLRNRLSGLANMLYDIKSVVAVGYETVADEAFREILYLEKLLDERDRERDSLASDVLKLMRIVEKLPLTGDNVRVIPGDESTKLYNPDYHGSEYFQLDASWIEHTPDCDCQWSVSWGGPDYDASSISDWYTSEEAAMASKVRKETNGNSD